MKYYAQIGERSFEFTFERRGNELWARDGDDTYRIDLGMIGDGTAFGLMIGDRSFDLLVDTVGGETLVQLSGELVRVVVQDERERTASQVAAHKSSGKQEITAVMPGIVVDVKVAVGDTVAQGDVLLVLEAMKMQNPLTAEAPGVVQRVLAQKGQAVAGGALLVELAPVDGA